MASRYLRDGEDFGPEHFSKDFGFHGSSHGAPRHDARNHPADPDDEEYGDGSYVEKMSRGGAAHHVHPHGHRIVHVEQMRDGSVVHHHEHGGYTVHHRTGEVSHFARGGQPCMAEGGHHRSPGYQVGGPVTTPTTRSGAPAMPGPSPAAPVNRMERATITMPLSDAAQAQESAVRAGQAMGAKQTVGALASTVARARAMQAMGRGAMERPAAASAPAAAPPQEVSQLARGGRASKKAFNPGGHKGKLHREMGIPEGEKIPAARLESATHSANPEIRRDAIRAETMKRWHRE